MSSLEVKISDLLLLKQVNEIAAKEKVSVDQIVSVALEAQVSAWQIRDTVAVRAKPGSEGIQSEFAESGTRVNALRHDLCRISPPGVLSCSHETNGHDNFIPRG
jgi:hypothetical protein